MPANNSYYTRNFGQGQALIRARKPYLIRNAVTGFALTGVVGAVYWYTLHAVGQENFDDVKIPDTPSAPTKS
ncbi:hypothetical protein CFIMG_004000RA [Ceratocystis fimbriata CBS 114723]|uniref:Cytochrome c oxidase assembly factor 3 n=1 Tax=Ceratocystis fimbriata CBS 114723 TaxID=1035309 RepID=A0A2C5WVZ5_9PEZI|nr:hypothetical protein CFIMG_004000RA [Ceratocystis fimbriata CBS 114723]